MTTNYQAIVYYGNKKKEKKKKEKKKKSKKHHINTTTREHWILYGKPSGIEGKTTGISTMK